MSPAGRRARSVCLAAAALLAAPAPARADGLGLSLNLEPALTVGTQENTDQLGHTTSQELRTLTQGYRLALDRQVSPVLSVYAGALLQDRTTRATTDGRGSTFEETTRGGSARLSLALPALSGGVTYDQGDARVTGAPTLRRDEVAGYLSWRPVDLPEVSARLTRSHSADTARAVADQTVTGALLSVRYQDAPLEAKYVLLWSRPADGLTGTESSTIDQVAQATYSGRLLEDRTVVYAAATLRNQVSRTLAAGSGSLSLQQHPVAGLSLIETFPAQPADATPLPNPALVDGNLTAGAAVDLGAALAVAGDTNRRDLAVQLGDVLTAVNQVQVWVDRRLPPAVVAAYAWSAWRSDDGKAWSPVAITGPVTFSPFQPAFEIPIQETRARFLKVVTQPLQAGVTTDPAFATVLVTELQVFLVGAASALPRLQATSGATVNLAASTQLWARANLSWDLTALLERRLSPDATVWSLLNGLNANQALARGLLLNERLARQDGDYGAGRLGQTEWGLGLSWKPLPALSGTLAYGGQYVDAHPVLDLATGRYTSQPGGWSNSLSSLARADLYEGVSTQVNLSTGLVNEPTGKNTWSGTLNTTASLVPNPQVTLTLAWISNLSSVWVGNQPPVTSSSARVDAGLTLRVTSAISAAATVGRRLTGAIPTTSGSAQVNYAPLRGDLQLTAAYSSTFDTASQSTLRTFAPGLRWSIRPGVQATASWSMLDTSSPVGTARSRLLGVGLGVSL